MSLSQGQIIRSLAEALAWFEKELSWKVEAGELRHLTGRIGELYAAMISRGQMALAVNQRGYDVVSADGEHISVKTFTTSTHVNVKKSTLAEVDRVMILRINIDEGEASIEEVFDGPKDEFLLRCHDTPTDYQFFPNRVSKRSRSIDDLKVTAEVVHGAYKVIQFENGTVIVELNGVRQPSAILALKTIAEQIGVSPLNGQGNKRNTRHLGSAVIAALNG